MYIIFSKPLSSLQSILGDIGNFSEPLFLMVKQISDLATPHLSSIIGVQSGPGKGVYD